MRYFFSLLALAGALLASLAHAASLQVSPVMLNFQPQQSALGITLRNNGDTPLTGQVRIFAWSQDGKDDSLTPVKTLIASPPMMVIAPQAEQLVRVVRTDSSSVAHEVSYRLLIDELPPPQNSGSADAVSTGINFRLRYSIPVFVAAGSAAAEPELDWTLRQHDGGWFLAVANHGGHHAQISAVKLIPPSGASFQVSAGLLGYALAGSGREWRLAENFPAADAAAGLKVQATINTKPWPAAAVNIEGSQ